MERHMIDTASIAADGSDIRSLVKTAVVDADPQDVWSAWTSSEAIAAWWDPPSSRIELRIGGPFELLFAPDQPEGLQGSEGCRYLAYVPREMVAFTWNAPPHLALREAHTWVVVTFSALDEASTRVRLVHTGFLEGPDWDAYMDYFESAWGYVLDLLSNHWSAA
jgi:uncharacterized protein YndB with AHSA1/START domain